MKYYKKKKDFNVLKERSNKRYYRFNGIEITKETNICVIVAKLLKKIIEAMIMK